MNDTDATQVLLASSRGDPKAAAELMPLVYDRLRALAGRYMKGERPEHTLQPTALVNEAFLALVRIEAVDWEGKTHFYAMAARQMQRVLVDHARKRGARKRAGEMVSLKSDIAGVAEQPIEFHALHQALGKLEKRNPRQSQVAELRFFAGLREKEIAHVLGVSERTVRNDWLVARAWLAGELKRGTG